MLFLVVVCVIFCGLYFNFILVVFSRNADLPIIFDGLDDDDEHRTRNVFETECNTRMMIDWLQRWLPFTLWNWSTSTADWISNYQNDRSLIPLATSTTTLHLAPFSTSSVSPLHPWIWSWQTSFSSCPVCPVLPWSEQSRNTSSRSVYYSIHPSNLTPLMLPTRPHPFFQTILSYSGCKLPMQTWICSHCEILDLVQQQGVCIWRVACGSPEGFVLQRGLPQKPIHTYALCISPALMYVQVIWLHYVLIPPSSSNSNFA